MEIRFEKISKFERGTLLALIRQAYSFDEKWERICDEKWQADDRFFYDHLELADKYAFITTLNGEPVGFAAYDPRNLPEYAIVGDNCIIPKHKGKGLGISQMRELLRRISMNGAATIYVSTNFELLPAQKMYEQVGFKKLDNSNLEPWQIEQRCDIYYCMKVEEMTQRGKNDVGN
jgi:predicted N-acetyltransferase YhbS